MSMRIDGKTSPTDAEAAARRLESTPGAERGSRAGSAKPAGDADRVDVSADAQLVAAAVQAAADAPAIRQDAVERARRALENGTLGSDSSRLAERIIESLLDSGPQSGE